MECLRFLKNQRLDIIDMKGTIDMKGLVVMIGKRIKGLALVIIMGVFLLSPQETFAEESTDKNGIEHEEVSGGVKTLVEFQSSLKALSIEELEKIKQDTENKGSEEDKEYIPYIEIELENKRELENVNGIIEFWDVIWLVFGGTIFIVFLALFAITVRYETG